MEQTVNYFRKHFGHSHLFLPGNSVRQEIYVTTNELGTSRLSLNRASIARSLGIMASILILASSTALLADYLTGYDFILIHKLVKFFYVELELNAPAFFSMLLLLCASLLLAVITVFKKKQAAPFVLEWSILSFGFLYMAFDEIVAVHERLIEPMRSILGETNLGIFYFAWVVPAIALILILAVFFLRFLLNLPMKTRVSFLIAAALYLGGAVGLELIEGKHSEIHGKETLIYIVLTTLEEWLEMIGTIVFIWALLGYMADICKGVDVRFGPRTDNQ